MMKKKSVRIVAFSGIAGVALLMTLVFGVFAAGPYNVEVADRFHSKQAILDDDAIVQYIGDLDATLGSSGTGVFNSFVRLQGNEKKTPNQKGYNTDGTLQYDTKGGQWTHSILLSEIPTVSIGGELFWEFFADINETDNTKKISLDDFELYLTDDPDLTGYDFGSNADEIYDYGDANTDYILINDVNQGSGRGDLRYLVPQDGFDPGDCNYGNPACATYLVLYSVWGGKGNGYGFDGGFEEWKVKKYPILQVSKTIEGSYDTPVTWTIDKEFDATYDLFTGESVTHEYQVSVDPIFGNPQNVLISGTITIEGDDDDDVNAIITDLFNGSAVTITGCSVPQNGDSTYTILSGDTITCDYEKSLNAPINGTNVATATYTISGNTLAFTGDADILEEDFGETLTGYPTINVTDTNGEEWTTSVAATWTYTETYSCDADEGQWINVATIMETDQSAGATVDINCYEPTVTKTADEFLVRQYTWEITKSVSPATWNLFTGESGVSDYTVVLNQIGYTDNNWKVTGNITIANPHPTRVAELTAVVDNAGGFAAPVICPATDVPAGGQIVCTYDTGVKNSPNVNPFGALNTATATQQLYDFDENGVGTADGTADYQATAAIDFSQAIIASLDEQATVSDTFAGSNVTGTFGGDHTFNYSRTFSCDANEGTHNNTASFVTNDTPLNSSANASVTVNCYDLDVTKSADEFYTRYFTWELDKQVDNPGPITVPSGSSVTLNYSVIVDVASYTDNDWKVSGNITIDNNHPSRAADLTQVIDNAGGISTTVNCPALVVPAGGSLVCTYTTSPQNSPDSNPFGALNTATATQQLYDFASNGTPSADGTTNYVGTHAIDFTQATVSYVDEIITLTDTLYGNLGTANALLDSLPKTFNYSYTYTAPAGFCGATTVDNTAAFTTNDTSTTGSDSVSVPINVPCGDGCTPGFWQGGAGAELWDEFEDPEWDAGNYATQFNPFTHDTKFNTFFPAWTLSALDGVEMFDLVDSGGTSVWAIKAARDMVAAYLNESAFPSSFPATSLADLTAMWYAAVNGGDAGLEAFHNLVSGWNDPLEGSCPLP